MNPTIDTPPPIQTFSVPNNQFDGPKRYQIITVALGAIFGLAGIFLTCAAFQLFPQGANFMSHLGTVKYVIAFTPLGIGFANLALGIIMCLSNKAPAVKNVEIDLSQITPETLADFLDLSHSSIPKNAREGDFFFQAGDNDQTVYGHLLDVERRCYACLVVQDGRFFHKVIGNDQPGEAFSNLKDYLDYLLSGRYPVGDSISALEFLCLKTADGTELIYPNVHRNV